VGNLSLRDSLPERSSRFSLSGSALAERNTPPNLWFKLKVFGACAEHEICDDLAAIGASSFIADLVKLRPAHEPILVPSLYGVAPTADSVFSSV
jgi:hypothetical protein